MYHLGMTRKIAISVPDDVAARLEREPNVSAFIAESVRIRMRAENVRRVLADLGFDFDDETRDRTASELDALQAAVTPELRRQAAELQARVRNGRP